MSEVSEIRDMSDEQLNATLQETYKTLFRLRIQSQTERLDVPSELTRNRRMIARIKTVQSERRIAAAKQKGAENEAETAKETAKETA